MKIAAFNVFENIEKDNLKEFQNSVNFFESKGFNVILPEKLTCKNIQKELKEDLERILLRKPLLALPTFCKKDEVNFIKNINYKKIAKSQTIFCGNSFITPFLNAISKNTKNPVIYGPNFISNFNLENKENIYINLISKISMLNSVEEISFEDALFYGKKTIKGILVGGEINSFLKMYPSKMLPKLTKKHVLLIDGIFESVLDVEKVVKDLNKYKILNKVKAILVFESIIDNEELLKTFLTVFKKLKKANIVVGLRGMLSEEINILQLNKEVKINFKQNKIWQ